MTRWRGRQRRRPIPRWLSSGRPAECGDWLRAQFRVVMLSDAARAQMEAAEQRRADGWAGRRPLVDPRSWRTATDARLVDTGWEVWSCERTIANEEAIGGIVVASAAKVDAETGEISEGWIVRNAFVRPDDRRSRRRVDAGEVLIPDGLVQPQADAIVRLIRRLARYLVEHDQPWLTATDLDAIRDLWALTGAVA